MESKILFRCFSHVKPEVKKVIEEAIALEDRDDAERHGWKYLGYGLFRFGYQKGDVVVKFDKGDSTSEIDVRFYRQVPARYKRHLARIYFASPGKVVQRYANPIDLKDKDMMGKANQIRILLGVNDAYRGHNTGIIDGRSVIYDWNTDHVYMGAK